MHPAKSCASRTADNSGGKRAPVGFVAVALNACQERMGAIDIVGVDPDYQRRGISSGLTEFAKQHMRSCGMGIAVARPAATPVTHLRELLTRRPVSRSYPLLGTSSYSTRRDYPAAGAKKSMSSWLTRSASS